MDLELALHGLRQRICGLVTIKFTEQDSGRRYRMGDLTAAKPGGDTSYEWRVKRLQGGDWEADLTNEYTNPLEGWDYKGVLPYQGRYWAYSRGGMATMAQQGRLVYTRNGMPNYKRILGRDAGRSLAERLDRYTPGIQVTRSAYGLPHPEAACALGAHQSRPPPTRVTWCWTPSAAAARPSPPPRSSTAAG